MLMLSLMLDAPERVRNAPDGTLHGNGGLTSPGPFIFPGFLPIQNSESRIPFANEGLVPFGDVSSALEGSP